jgi:hypothetical protein
MTNEIRVSDQDPELAAMKAVARAFEGLDRGGCARVVEWARKRYVDRDLVPFGEFDSEGFARFTDALRQATLELGNIAPIDVLRFAEYVRELKEREAA